MAEKIYIGNTPTALGPVPMEIEKDGEIYMRINGLDVLRDTIILQTLIQRNQMSIYNHLWIVYENIREYVYKYISPETKLWHKITITANHEHDFERFNTGFSLDTHAEFFNQEFINTYNKLWIKIEPVEPLETSFTGGGNELWIKANPAPFELMFLVHPSHLRLYLDSINTGTFKSGWIASESSLFISASVDEQQVAHGQISPQLLWLVTMPLGLMRMRLRLLGEMDDLTLGDFDDMLLRDVDRIFVYD